VHVSDPARQHVCGGRRRRSRDREKAAGVTAAELMTSPPVTIGPDEPVQQGAFLMYDRAVSRLPVVLTHRQGRRSPGH
jgi:CBS domain-containing protein